METPGLPSRPAQMTTEQMLERLATLKPIATLNRGKVKAGDPRRLASEEYAWILEQALRSGVTTKQLTAVTGHSWSTLRTRLARHGYRHRSPSLPAYLGPDDTPPPTTCGAGHKFTVQNTYRYVDPSGAKHRVCRACRAARMRERRQKTVQENRLRPDQGTLSEPTVSKGARRSGGLTLDQVCDLVEELSGRRPLPETLRSYLSRGSMPPRGDGGLFDREQIVAWAQRQRRPDAKVVAGFQKRLAGLRTPAGQARAVAEARAANVSWAAIGQPLGLTRQSAHQRFSAMIDADRD